MWSRLWAHPIPLIRSFKFMAVYFEFMVMGDAHVWQIFFSCQVCLASHQWIFNASLDKSLPPAFCIRHDVDALVWQPKAHSDSEANWIHTGTFNALGYVQAAKRDRKFSTCAPDLSYAVICDNTRHVYVYQQPVGSAKHANQQVVTLTTSDNEILGLQASNNRIFVLTRQAVHVVTVT